MVFGRSNSSFNQAKDKFMHLHLLKDADPERYKSTLLEAIFFCQKAIRENAHDGDAHIMLANSYYLATHTPLPGKYYTYFMPLAAAVIFHWKNSRLRSGHQRNGEILLETIRDGIDAPIEYWAEAMPLESTDFKTLHDKFYDTAITQDVSYPSDSAIAAGRGTKSGKTKDVLPNDAPDWVKRLFDILFLCFFTGQVKDRAGAREFVSKHSGSMKDEPGFVGLVDWAIQLCEKEYKYDISEAAVISEKWQSRFGKIPVKLLEEEIFRMISEIVYLFRRGKNLEQIQVMLVSNSFPFRKYDQQLLDLLGEISDSLVVAAKDRLTQVGGFNFSD